MDEDGEEWADLEAVTIFLQITNGKTDGATIKGLRASLRTVFDKFSLPLRNDVTDLRHGEVELVEVGTILAMPPPKKRFASFVFKPPLVIDRREGEYLRRGGDQRSLKVAGGHKLGLGAGVPFYVILTAEDTVARAVRYVGDFSLPEAYQWLRQDQEGAKDES